MKRNLRPELKAAIDERLESAITASNYRITLNNQKQNARLKLEKDLTYSVNGGIFKITPELISFIQTLVSMGQENVVLLDINKNPIEIADIHDFQDDIVNKYYECMNGFLAEFKSIQKLRTTKALLGE